eukprot:CAMPEP_0176448190 /NCGR_PEP_ID=MMETSP0127-20121128/25603_1 /TAXON_ID=938130 /ORGANISM="Platyophrya macrostoma, Strain WH" /LENGTH=409 /DNA_ID=CAMNT_0017835027 /DNA_START=36 /DNA_END=1265 /DNA_ORIENTATION=+
MNKTILFAFALLATTALAAVRTDCYGYNSTLAAVFEIDSLGNGTEYIAEHANGTLHYDFCEVPKVNASECNVSNSTAVFMNNVTKTCVRLTNGTIPKWYAMNETDPLGGVYLVYGEGDQVPGAGDTTYNYTVMLSCVVDGSYNLSRFDITGAHGENYIVSASSKYGCPVFAFYQLSNFVTQYKVIFIIVGIVIGAFVGFFGLRMFKPTLFLIGFVITTLFFLFILFTFALGINPTVGAQWGCLAGSLVLGILAGILAVKLEKVGVFLLGAWLGTSGSFLLYSLILSHFNAGRVVLIIFSVVLALITGILALLIFEHVVIIATAFTGAYLVIRGASLFAPAGYTYPNEIEIARDIQYNGFAHIPWTFYLYFPLIVIITIAGAYVQYRHKRARDEEKAQDDMGYLAFHQQP